MKRGALSLLVWAPVAAWAGAAEPREPSTREIERINRMEFRDAFRRLVEEAIPKWDLAGL